MRKESESSSSHSFGSSESEQSQGHDGQLLQQPQAAKAKTGRTIAAEVVEHQQENLVVATVDQSIQQPRTALQVFHQMNSLFNIPVTISSNEIQREPNYNSMINVYEMLSASNCSLGSQRENQMMGTISHKKQPSQRDLIIQPSPSAKQLLARENSNFSLLK